MFDFTLGGNGVVLLHYGIEQANARHLIVPAHLGFDGGRCGKNARACLAEHAQQRGVLKLAHDHRTNTLQVEPLLERAARRRIGHGEKKWRPVQAAWKALAISRCQGGCGEQRDAARPEHVIEHAHTQHRLRRRVCQHQVQFVRRETQKQPVRLVLITGELHAALQFKSRLQNAVGDQLGDQVRDAHQKPHRTALRTALQHVG